MHQGQLDGRVMKHFKNFIGGRWVEGVETLTSVNPSDTDDLIGTYALVSAAQMDDAVAAATNAFASWSRTSIQVRHDVLKHVGDTLAARSHELGILLAREEGKTLPEGVNEVLRASQIFLFFAGECLRIAGDKVDSVRAGVEIDVTREAIGVVGVITPWNIPLAIPAWKIAPALAFGNCVVFKPAGLVPACAHALAEILSTSGLPSGAFNLVMGRGNVVGNALTGHPDVAAITFTGSVATGRQIAAACVAAPRMKKVQLELGGKSPLLVLDDADLDVAVECAVNGAFYSTGQRCTASSRLIVTDGIHERFVAAMKARMQALVVDDALKSGTQIGPVVDHAQLDQDLSYIAIGLAENAKLVEGGERLQRAKSGFYLSPALFTDVSNEMRIAREEIFGPIAVTIRARNYDEALELANDTEFGLSSGICTTSLKHATHFRRNSEAGMVMVNLPTAGADYHVPFGGRKASSYGPREQGRSAQEFYTVVKTSYVQA